MVGTDVQELTLFWVSLCVSFVATIIGTYLGKPADMVTLEAFYKKIRPFGFWKPVRKNCDPALLKLADRENRFDKLMLIPACLFQLVIFWMMTALVIRKKWDSFAVSFVILCILAWILYKYWYKNLAVNQDNHNNTTQK
jgi:hypothetical protein